MKRFLILVAISCAFTAPVRGESSADQGDGPLAVEEMQVLAAEDEYVAAEISRDAAALDRLVDDEFVYNAADGTTSGKEELIRVVLSMDMTDQTISERTVIVEGGVAVICGTAELRFAGTDEAPRLSRLRYTSVYIKRIDQWRMLALQMQPRSSR